MEKYKVVDAGNLLDKEVQKYTKRMSNWQRNQWARAGYPKTKIQLEKFVQLSK